MICIYDARATSFDSHGLGILHPTSCEVNEEADGAYELTVTVPATEAREDLLLALERLVKVSGAPKREAAREQLFRIYELQETDDGAGVTARAQHISYDLAYNAVRDVIHTEPTPADQVARELLAAMVWPDHGFTLEASCTTPIRGDWRFSGGINAFLDQEAGVVRQARARLIRDNKRIILLPEGAPESGAVIRYGGDLTGLSRKRGCAQVYTRLIPVGETEGGAALYLPEVAIDSPRLADYSYPRVHMWKVSGAKVGTKNQGGQALTEATVLAMMRDAAQELLRSGCDQEEAETEVGYLDLSRTEHFHTTAPQDICLYDTVTIVTRDGETMRMAVSGYTYDCLAQRYTGLKVGGVYNDRTANVVATAPQLRKTQRILGDHNGRLELIAQTISLQADLIEANARLILLKADSTVVTALSARVSHAEVDIDGINAAVLLKADRDELRRVDDQLTHRITSAEVKIDGANAAILLKADQIVTDALGTRLSAAEIAIDGANSQIALKADTILLNGYVKASTFEAEMADIRLLAADVANLKALTSMITSAGVISADTITTSYISAVNSFNAYGHHATWQEHIVKTGNPAIALDFTNFTFRDGDGQMRTIRLVQGATASGGASETIRYLGR